ncbi:MAG: 50S ribosomal protein L25 [Prevotellaceae bacterium]|jgi:large subunit ribosomal protein L25|nr:50S ribosomal protein L25 [Prevotellaceae bacterium]
MKTFKLEGQPRTELGKKSVKAFRNEGLIPAVLYGGKTVELPYSGKLAEGENLIESQGKGLIVTNFTVSFDGIRKLVYSPEIYLVELTLGKKTHQAILKDLQFHPVSDQILHLDFLAVFPDKPIVIEVPVVTEGFAAGVRAGGKLNLVSRKLKVKALAKDVPETLKINVDSLELGKSIMVRDLSFDNLEMISSSNNVVCSVVATRGSKAAVEEAAKK